MSSLSEKSAATNNNMPRRISTTILARILWLILATTTSLQHAVNVEAAAAATTTIITIEEVSKHSDKNDCWSSIYGRVFDLTFYAPNHPGNGGGGDTVYLLCGTEGTNLYNSFHGNNPQYLTTLPGILDKGELGTLSPTSSPSANPTTLAPTGIPSTFPSSSPSTPPTITASDVPTANPSIAPSNLPSTYPSVTPSSIPSVVPSAAPSTSPSQLASDSPSLEPSTIPSQLPTRSPSSAPTDFPSQPPTLAPTISPAPTFAPTEVTFHTLATVAQHSHPNDCWSSIHGHVYDLSAYALIHPGNGGGSDTVYLLCGIEGSALYDSFHRNNPQYLKVLPEIFFKGQTVSRLPTEPPTKNPTIQPTTATPTTLSPSTSPPSQLPSQPPTVTASDLPTSTPSVSPSVVPSADPSFVPTATSTSNMNGLGGQNFLAINVSKAPAIIFPEELAKHNTPNDCWVAYFDEVYDVTTYAPTHPAGAALVTQNCGEDGTDSYKVFHTYEELEEIRDHFLGRVMLHFEVAEDATTTTTADAINADTTMATTTTTTPAPTPTQPCSSAVSRGGGDDSSEDSSEDFKDPCMMMPIPAVTGPPISLEELRLHNNPDDCWVSYYGEIFDVTEYAPRHPGGASIVTTNCGHDDTESYSMFHNYQELAEIRSYFKGLLQTETDNHNNNSQTEAQVGTADMNSPGQVSSSATSDVPITNNGMISFSTLQQHSTPEDCWVAYYGEVYAMSRYAPDHPAGSQSITADCGKDGTEGYKAFHERSLLVLVKQDYLGELDTATVVAADTDPPHSEPRALTMEELASNDNPGSCWVRYWDEVFDLTYYSHPSPPGQSVIYLGCGKDSTKDFATAHPRNLLEDVAKHKIGWIESSASSGLTIGLTSVFIMVAQIFIFLA